MKKKETSKQEVKINPRLDYGMDISTVLAQVEAWKKAGYTVEEIQEELDNLAREPEEGGEQ